MQRVPDSGSEARLPEGREKRRPTRGRRAAIVGLLFLLVAGGLGTWYRSVNADGLLSALTDALSEGIGAEVSIRSVTLGGLDRIVLHDVAIEADVPLEARRVVAVFSLGDWFRKPGDPLAALRWLRIDDWQVTLAPEDSVGDDRPTMSLASLLADFGARFGMVGGMTPEDDEFRPGDGDPPPAVGDPSAGREWSAEQWAALLQPFVDYEWVDGGLDVYLRDGNVLWAESEGLAAASAEGTFVLGEGRLLGRNVRLRPGGDGNGARVTVNGTVWPRSDLYVQAEFSDVELLGMRPSTGFDHVKGEAWIVGSWPQPKAWGTVRIRDLTLPWWADYTVDETVVQWGYVPGGPIEMLVDGIRDHARVRLQGEVAPGGALHFDVAATDLSIPKDVPVVEARDVQGAVDVAGVLRGTWADPVLTGEAMADGGYLFGEPVSDLQGNVQVTRTGFSFHTVRVAQGNSTYYLDGEIGFSETKPFELVLRTDHGRAETLLSVLGWDIPLQARLAGSLHFLRPEHDVIASGELTLERGRAWEQPFDRLDGRFRYAGGAFQLKDVTGTVRGGTVTAAGGSPWSDDSEALWQRFGRDLDRWAGAVEEVPEEAEAGKAGWTLAVQAEDIPLQAVALWRGQWPDVSGLADFTGTVHGDFDETMDVISRVEGTLAGRHVVAGTIDFVEAHGNAVWEPDTLHIPTLTLHRRGGGVYDVAGAVTDMFGDARMRFDFDVRDESVEALVALSDWRLPLLAHSDPLRAFGTLEGPLAAPEAQLHVEADTVYVAGRPAPLALDLRWRNGRIEVENGFLRQGNVELTGT